MGTQDNWVEMERGEEAVTEDDEANSAIPAITQALPLQHPQGFLWPRESALPSCVLKTRVLGN